MTFSRQNEGKYIKHFNVLKPFCLSFSHFFQIKIGRGAFIREVAFIRINMVCTPSRRVRFDVIL